MNRRTLPIGKHYFTNISRLVWQGVNLNILSNYKLLEEGEKPNSPDMCHEEKNMIM
jgi:hypothetical protein